MTENIYEMYARNEGANFFVRRDSWSNPHTAARIISVAGQQAGALLGKPPYFGNPEVIAEVVYGGKPIRREKLSCPGTYAYQQIERPNWWPTS